MTSGDHYFSASPASPADLRSRRVRLWGRDVEVATAGGVFSPDHVDLGTRVLLDHVPDPPATGTFVDVGCGWGPIALSLGIVAPRARVVAVDVNERALDLTRRNAATLGLTGVEAFDAEAALAALPPGSVDLLWSNPPVRIGKEALHALLTAWLDRLVPSGEAYLVVQRNLGADSLHAWLTAQGREVTRVGSAKGFRVLRVAGTGVAEIGD